MSKKNAPIEPDVDHVCFKLQSNERREKNERTQDMKKKKNMMGQRGQKEENKKGYDKHVYQHTSDSEEKKKRGKMMARSV